MILHDYAHTKRRIDWREVAHQLGEVIATGITSAVFAACVWGWLL